MRTHARGVALLMVLSVMAATTILAWAMLSSSAMRSQIDMNAGDALEASTLAESGASYAMHCLRYPDRCRPVTADPVTWFYPGETGLRLWSDARGTVDITVTNTGTNIYKIRSTASVPRADNSSQIARSTIEAFVTLNLQGVVVAGGFNGATFAVPSAMHIVGTVVAKGGISNPGNVSSSPAVVASGTDVVATLGRVTLLVETASTSTLPGSLSTDRMYTFNGNTYLAEKAPATIGAAGLTSQRPSLNPCNVWYSGTNVLLSNANFSGVLVVRDNAILSVTGPCNVNATSGMPAIIASKSIDLKSAVSDAKLSVNGIVWIGDQVTATAPDKTSASIKINGALLMGGAAPKFAVAAKVDVNYGSNVASVTRLSTVPTIGGLTVTGWRSVD